MTSSASNSQKLNKSQCNYVRLLLYVKPYWLTLTLALVASGCYASIDAWFVYFLQPLLNKGLIQKNSTFLHFAPVLILLVFICRGLSSGLANYNIASVATKVIVKMRQELFAHLQKLPAQVYDSHPCGKIIALILYNIEQVANASSEAITTAIQSICLIAGLLCVMLTISWKLTLLYFVIMPCIVIVMRFTSVRIHKISLSIQESIATLNHLLTENIKGYQIIKAFNGRDHEQKRFDQALAMNRKREMKIVMARGIGVSGVQIIAALALSGTLYLATLEIANSVLSTGGFISIIAAMLAIIKPLKDLTQMQNKLHRGLAGAQTAFEFLAIPPEPDCGTAIVSKVHGNIVFKQVNFSYYPGKKHNLHNINLQINSGEMLAIIGKSGSGKSTLVNLLLRFYNNYQGQILLDNKPIEDYRLSNFRQQIALVSQQGFLFHDTVANNIAYGVPHPVSEQDILCAAEAAHALEFINTMPEGLNTIIGENGITLSGGQRQRLAIARAFLKQAPIIILDEATSALDSETEKHIQQALQNLIINRSTIVIAHRLSTIEQANKIAIFDKGKIIAVGTHQDLLHQNKHYQKLYHAQFSCN